MNANQKFFSKQAESVNEGYASFDDELYADNWNADSDSWNAEGSDEPTSNPYIVTLTNTTGAAVSSVKFLDAAVALRANAVNYGVNAGIVPSYGIAGVEYVDFLYTILTQPMEIGETYIGSDSTSQLNETIKIETNNARGDSRTQTFSPLINPYQYQSTGVIMPNKFTLNGFTKLTINQILAGKYVTFRFYPKAVTNSLQGLSGKSKVQFANPNITRGRIS